MLSNDDRIFSLIDSKIFPGIVDNVHLNRVASLCYAMIELLKFGQEYASQIVRNSQALAKALAESGVPVKCRNIGYTKSHQVLLGYEEKVTPQIADFLQDCDIIVDAGIRLGTSEVTRRGMKETEMEEIAEIISDGLVKKKSSDELKKRVQSLVSEFSSTVAFTLR